MNEWGPQKPSDNSSAFVMPPDIHQLPATIRSFVSFIFNRTLNQCTPYTPPPPLVHKCSVYVTNCAVLSSIDNNIITNNYNLSKHKYNSGRHALPDIEHKTVTNTFCNDRA